MILEVNRYAKNGYQLGPATACTAVVWLHGCDRGCKGCIAFEWNNSPARERYPAEMLADILCKDMPALDCIVLSGGEPFRQPEGILELLQALGQKLKKPVGVMIYTGYRYEELLVRAQHEPAVGDVLARTDVLIDGPYIAEQDDEKPYRGSRNQRMLFLSDRFSEADFPAKTRSAKIESGYGEITLSGIPDNITKKRWHERCAQIKAAQNM